MEIEYDLALLAENLAHEIPEISEIYLFGSRARGTKSIRSDVDVLVVSTKHIQPHLLREFSFKNCEALDLFIVDGGKATSSQNESFIEADDQPSLLTLLGAIKIWSRAEGRARADIEWRFKVREGVEYPATALPNISLKNENRSSTPFAPSCLTLKEIIGGLTAGQFWSLCTAIFALLGAVGGMAYWLGTKFGQIGTPPLSN